jgi:hypothetical protein
MAVVTVLHQKRLDGLRKRVLFLFPGGAFLPIPQNSRHRIAANVAQAIVFLILIPFLRLKSHIQGSGTGSIGN